ncbi:MAG: lyase family protein [Actinocrinis sp.]
MSEQRATREPSRPSSWISQAADDPLGTLLDAEAALVRAKAALGRIPHAAADAVTAATRPQRYDLAALREAAEQHATIVVPLVEAIRAELPRELRDTVHQPATSQDIIDTALMLQAARTLDPLIRVTDHCLDAISSLIDHHGDTPQLARTLLQPALATTFGALLAAWASAIDDARAHLAHVREHGLAVQLAGPVGDLDDPDLVAAFAAQLELAAPDRPWHTVRTRIVDLAAALGLLVGALGKVATDVILLSQTEIGELSEGGAADGGGRSSSMPDKRNPARAVQIVALAQRTPGLVATVFAALPQELHRAAGRWQAEDEAVRELLALAVRAAAHASVMLDGLQVHPERMKANLR